MVNELLVSLVNSVLGIGKRTSKGNHSYNCPFCNHHKPKLEINFTDNKNGDNPWHCWACDKKGRKLRSLFKQIKENVKLWMKADLDFKKKNKRRDIFCRKYGLFIRRKKRKT